MSPEITWYAPIQLQNLQITPEDLSAPNALDVSRKATVVFSGVFEGGDDPSAEVEVLFFNKITQTFGRTGVVFTLSEDSNLEIFNPAGLPLGFVVTVHGSPTDFSLLVGSR